MSVIDILCDQHRRMRVLLDLLEREVAAFERGEAFDAYIVDGTLDYVANYPDRLHRPLELRVYEAMLRHRGAGDPISLAAADAEHASLSATARELRNAIVAVRRNAAPPRSFVAARAAKFIVGLRHHMDVEEQRVFPVARATLTADDEARIERVTAEDVEAPARAEEERAYAALHEAIARQRDLGLAR